MSRRARRAAFPGPGVAGLAVVVVSGAGALVVWQPEALLFLVVFAAVYAGSSLIPSRRPPSEPDDPVVEVFD